ncbi:YggT family protein [Salisediminibacterium halotolerans]|uniref:YggT family protein n=1 Tax=Salisediminibacterium halotolerans TaxID=517425 RepID=UPI000EAD41DB|nr:YggT family protein [Salisediminibacterium halotolerans]RLJ74297.1 YggT family protein [Actinophytocola xinjiangensis]RPE87610.1 YggT family protein [Salisediminibacterium halotolerans]TWG35134.1 YggT family protein [Salisediminibacterium halotolerans]GEL07307.1 membrane protein [Salisediminibacterium halotolerans]
MQILENIIVQAIQLYSIICIIYIFMSWIPNARESEFGRIIGKIVEPLFAPFRQVIPPIGMIDISPIVAILALRFAITGVEALFGFFY